MVVLLELAGGEPLPVAIAPYNLHHHGPLILSIFCFPSACTAHGVARCHTDKACAAEQNCTRPCLWEWRGETFMLRKGLHERHRHPSRPVTSHIIPVSTQQQQRPLSPELSQAGTVMQPHVPLMTQSCQPSGPSLLSSSRSSALKLCTVPSMTAGSRTGPVSQVHHKGR